MSEIALVKVTRLAVFVHPGQLKEGVVHLVAFCDTDSEYFELKVKEWHDCGAICLYDGPPVGKTQNAG